MKRSKFSLSHYKLFTCDMGELVPVASFEALPGDTIQASTSLLLRVSPLLSPVMHPVSVRVHWWFVPYRQIWDEWEQFITGGSDGEGDGYTYPTLSGTPAAGSLWDYMDVKPGINTSYGSLPIRAYNRIFNEHYRDEDLVTAVAETTNTAVQKVAWEKDYFTSARPWPQKGPEVTLPLGTRAPIRGIAKLNQVYAAGPSTGYETDGTGTTAYADYQIVDGDTANETFLVEEDPDNAGFPNIWADLSAASAVGVTDVRRAMALQRFAEARSRFGNRYSEYLRYLGVRSSDARLQRPEYLGGGKQTIAFSEVLQTGTNFDANTGVATLRGHGVAAARSRRWRYFCEEHGQVVALMSVRPRTMYAEGSPRQFNRRTKEDYFTKELEHIGQQEILKKEIYLQGTAADAETFGYQDRYSEYRHIQSGVATEFRSTLNFWHLARLFGTLPTLNSAFVACEPSKRINAVQNADVLWCMASHSIQARRMVSKHADGRIL